MQKQTTEKPVKRKVITRRVNVFLGIVVLIFLILVGRLAYLQLFETERYRMLATENSLRLIAIPASRGEIYDRGGKKLVGNRPLYNVSLIKLDQSEAQMDAVVEKLAGILETEPDDLREKIGETALRRFERVILAKDVPLEMVSRIEEAAVHLPGVAIDLEPMREYPYGSRLAHVLGYIREIQPQQLEEHREEGYRMGDQFGQDGLENTFEAYLRGEKGAQQIEVDAYERPVRSLGTQDPVAGHDLHLTIDIGVQTAAEDALAAAVEAAHKKEGESEAAAAVAIDVRNGDVLALASHPPFDPGMFAGNVDPAEVQEVFNSSARPFINRVIQSSYPPGSTFKMVTAAAALEEGVITPSSTVHDPGYYWHDRMYRCWVYPLGHGTVNLERALKVSCNTFFWTVGRMVGPEAMAQYAGEFGLGEKTGIMLNGETGGICPTAEYKREQVQMQLDRRFDPQFDEVRERYRPLIAAAADDGERKRLEKEMERELAPIEAQYERYAWELTWRDYDTLNMCVGQGYNAYTPLQLANYVAAIANDGILYRPRLVRRVVSHAGELVQEFDPEIMRQVAVTKENLAAIRKGMSEVTRFGGTGFGAFADFPVPTAGKTGTAEVSGKANHAVFVGYAPVDEPEIAVAVVVEHGGQGSTVGAPVARKIMEAYFYPADGRDEPVSADEEPAAETQSPPRGGGTPAPSPPAAEPPVAEPPATPVPAPVETGPTDEPARTEEQPEDKAPPPATGDAPAGDDGPPAPPDAPGDTWHPVDEAENP